MTRALLGADAGAVAKDLVGGTDAALFTAAGRGTGDMHVVTGRLAVRAVAPHLTVVTQSCHCGKDGQDKVWMKSVEHLTLFVIWIFFQVKIIHFAWMRLLLT